MQNLHLLESLEEAFDAMCTIINAWQSQWLVALGPPSIDNGTDGTEKLLLKTQLS